MPDPRRNTDEADVRVVGKTKIDAGEKAGETRAGSSLNCHGFSDHMHLNRTPLIAACAAFGTTHPDMPNDHNI